MEYPRTCKVTVCREEMVGAGDEEIVDVREDSDSLAVKCASCLGIQVCVPLITLMHIYILSQRQPYDTSCESRFFYSLPALACGSLLCCLLSLFVTNLTLTNKSHLLPALFFTAISSVYIAFGGGLMSAVFHLDPIRQGAGLLTQGSSKSDFCGLSLPVTLFLTVSMYSEFCISLFCFGYLLVKAERFGGKHKRIPLCKKLCVALFAAGLGLTQSVAPLYLNSENFRSLFFSSPCAHIDFVLEATCMYLCIFSTQTKSPSMKLLYSIIVIESMLLQWPSFGLDLAFLKLSSADCSDGTECRALTRLYLGISLKFLAVQALGLMELRKTVLTSCRRSRKRTSSKEVPLLSDPSSLI